MAFTKITGYGISETTDIHVGLITATNGVFSGNVTIGGTLTYEDVTNIDSVGIITARDGIDCNADLDVDGHTNLDNVNVGGATTTTGVVVINAGTQSTNTTSGALRVAGGAGIAKNVNVGGDLDVDGHTNLDNVSIAGVTTISDALHIESTQPRIYLTDTNHNSDWSIRNSDGTIYFYDETLTNTRFEIYPGNSPTTRPFIATPFTTDCRFDGFVRIGAVGNSPNHSLTVGGNSNFSGISSFIDIDVDGHTNLDNVSIAGVTTATENINIDADNKKLQIGDGQDFQLYWDGSDALIDTPGSGRIRLRSPETRFENWNGLEVLARFIGGATGRVELYHDNGNKKFETSATGITVTGTVVATGADINGDLDVDGHTDLDNVSVAGVTTMTASGTTVLRIQRSATDGPVLQIHRTGNTSGGGPELKVTDGFSSTSPVYGFWYNSTTGIGNPAANTTSFIQAGSEKVRITSTGAVGIGTDNPLQRLHVKQGSTTTPAMVEALGAQSHVKLSLIHISEPTRPY